MAKTQTTEQVQEKKIPLKLHVFMDSFDDSKTGEKREFVAAELIEPFPEYAEDFNKVRIAPRWERDAAIFKFRMRRFLKTSDDITVNGYCEPVGYLSKKPEEKGKMIYYPGIFFKLPYFGEMVEFGFKKRKETDKDGKVTFSESGDCYVFRDLISEKWGGNYEPAVGVNADDSAER